MQKPLATWNSARRAWEQYGQENTLCGHSALYSETWPTAGMMRNGQVSKLPMWEPPTSGSESSSSPNEKTLMGTPRATEYKGSGPVGSASHQDWLDKHYLTAQALQVQSDTVLLKTPTSQLAVNGGSQHPDKRKAGGHGPTLADEIEHTLPAPIAEDPSPSLFPTPRASDGKNGGPNQRGSKGDYALPAIQNLLPTPNTMDTIEPREGEAIGRQLRRGGNGSLRSTSGNLREDILLTIDPERYSRIKDKSSTGASTSQPSAEPNMSPDDQHPDPPNPPARTEPNG